MTMDDSVPLTETSEVKSDQKDNQFRTSLQAGKILVGGR